MNPLATELNEKLTGTVAGRLLSDFGVRMYFPKGIAAQSLEAREFASLYDATIGMPFTLGEPMMPDYMANLVAPLSRAEAVDYAPNGGVAELRQMWAKEISRKNPGLSGLQISSPTVVAGLTNGIFQLSDLFTDAGDRVIVPDLFWGNYRLIFAVRQKADMVTFPFYSDTGGFNTQGLSQALKGAKKAVVMLNFPNNPTGYSPTTEEAKAIASVLIDAAEAGTDILAVCDDAYFGLLYEEGLYSESIFSLLAGAHENLLAVKVDGPTKEDFVWGFRVGFVTFASKGLENVHYEALYRKLLGAIRSSVSSCSRPAQSLLIRALKDPQYNRQKLELFNELKLRYQTVKNFLDGEDCRPLTPLPFNSGYFMTFSFPGKAEELRVKLLHEMKVGTISMESDFLRVTYAAIDKDNIPSLFTHILSAASAIDK